MPFWVLSLVLCAFSPLFFHYFSLRIYQLCSYRISEFLYALRNKKAGYFLLGTLMSLVTFTVLVSIKATLKVCFFVSFFKRLSYFCVHIFA